MGFCRSSYLPIIVECCWTAASRSLSSIVHSPISEHPEETRVQTGQIPVPKNKLVRSPSPKTEQSVFCLVRRLSGVLWFQRIHTGLKHTSVMGCFYRPRAPRVPVRALWLVVCSERSASARPAACATRSLHGATRCCSSDSEADYCKPCSYFRSSHQVDGLRRTRLVGGRLDLTSCLR